MKLTSILMAMACALLSTPAAIAASSGDLYVQALQETVGPCTVMAYKAGLYAGGDPTGTTDVPTADDIRACGEAVKEKSAAVYKEHSAKAANAQIAKDMKDVFIAWLSYFPVRISAAYSNYDGSDDNNPEAAAFKKSVATLQVDEMTL